MQVDGVANSAMCLIVNTISFNLFVLVPLKILSCFKRNDMFVKTLTLRNDVARGFLRVYQEIICEITCSGIGHNRSSMSCVCLCQNNRYICFRHLSSLDSGSSEQGFLPDRSTFVGH